MIRMHDDLGCCFLLNTCLSKNSRVSFSMCPSYKFVVRLIRPIFERPKSVSLMWPIEVIRRLRREMQAQAIVQNSSKIF